MNQGRSLARRLATEAPNGRNKEDHLPVRLLTADEVAQRWQVPRAHVYRLGREGRLPTVRLGRYMRWRLDALEAFERDGGASPNA